MSSQLDQERILLQLSLLSTHKNCKLQSDLNWPTSNKTLWLERIKLTAKTINLQMNKDIKIFLELHVDDNF